MTKNIKNVENTTNNKNSDNFLFKIDLLEKYLKNKLSASKIANILNISIRQVRRLVKNYKEQGKLSLLHKLTNKPSNHIIDKDLKEKVLELAKTKYIDFNATLLLECLLKYDNIKVHHETLRLWLKQNKLQSKTRKRMPYRQKRERKQCFGTMLQIDGTFHDWFILNKDKNQRKACLINLIDDNTNIIELMFDTQETIKCACLLLWKWIKNMAYHKVCTVIGEICISQKRIRRQKEKKIIYLILKDFSE
jgi:transposase